MIALCKCGIDMTEHDDINHEFDASGTKHTCDKFIKTKTNSCPTCGCENYSDYYCPRPAWHQEEGVPCGPLTGEKLW